MPPRRTANNQENGRRLIEDGADHSGGRRFKTDSEQNIQRSKVTQSQTGNIVFIPTGLNVSLFDLQVPSEESVGMAERCSGTDAAMLAWSR